MLLLRGTFLLRRRQPPLEKKRWLIMAHQSARLASNSGYLRSPSPLITQSMRIGYAGKRDGHCYTPYCRRLTPIICISRVLQVLAINHNSIIKIQIQVIRFDFLTFNAIYSII